MLHPIFSTVLRHPELIADHAVNYAALLRLETTEAGKALITRLVAGVLAAVCAVLCLGLAGVAIMLGMLHGSFHWVLVLVPGVLGLIAAVAGYLAARPADFHGFAELRAQVDADLHALRLAGDERGR